MTTPDDPTDDLQQGLFSHLIELRSRLLKAVAAVVVILLVLVPFANRLYTELAAPLVARLPEGAHLIATEVASPFVTPLKLAFYAALFLGMPMILYQLWAFVSPGLYKHEKRLARPLLVAAMGLFYLGCAFAYFLVLPAAFRFLTAVTPQGVRIDLASPGSDALGRAGLAGAVDSFFWARFGGALLLSLVDDAAYIAGQAASSGNGNFNNVTRAPSEGAAIALQNNINIRPVLKKNQGEEVGIFVAKDFNFADVYNLELRR